MVYADLEEVLGRPGIWIILFSGNENVDLMKTKAKYLAFHVCNMPLCDVDLRYASSHGIHLLSAEIRRVTAIARYQMCQWARPYLLSAATDGEKSPISDH